MLEPGGEGPGRITIATFAEAKCPSFQGQLRPITVRRVSESSGKSWTGQIVGNFQGQMTGWRLRGEEKRGGYG